MLGTFLWRFSLSPSQLISCVTNYAPYPLIRGYVICQPEPEASNQLEAYCLHSEKLYMPLTVPIKKKKPGSKLRTHTGQDVPQKLGHKTSVPRVPGTHPQDVRSKKNTAMFNRSRERIGYTYPHWEDRVSWGGNWGLDCKFPPSFPRDDRSKDEPGELSLKPCASAQVTHTREAGRRISNVQ